ncbi:hypothetical protein [Streptomyces lydicus]|uniref:hypothetical protein n=1 Tax=Streptomyces lydicus TaxID=47763 RepID=UPI001010249D|nr:hypothetical protein [Streptomyces lydicus]
MDRRRQAQEGIHHAAVSDPKDATSAVRRPAVVPEFAEISQDDRKVSIYRSKANHGDFDQGEREFTEAARNALEAAADFVEYYEILQEWADCPDPERLSALCGYSVEILEKVANKPFYGSPVGMREAREAAVSATLSVMDQPDRWVIDLANDCQDAAKAAEEAHKRALMARRAWTEGRTEAIWIGRG